MSSNSDRTAKSALHRLLAVALLAWGFGGTAQAATTVKVECVEQAGHVLGFRDGKPISEADTHMGQYSFEWVLGEPEGLMHLTNADGNSETHGLRVIAGHITQITFVDLVSGYEPWEYTLFPFAKQMLITYHGRGEHPGRGDVVGRLRIAKCEVVFE